VFKGEKGRSDSIRERLKAGGASWRGDIGPTVDSLDLELGEADDSFSELRG
jgi:hypothetical protein